MTNRYGAFAPIATLFFVLLMAITATGCAHLAGPDKALTREGPNDKGQVQFKTFDAAFQLALQAALPQKSGQPPAADPPPPPTSSSAPTPAEIAAADAAAYQLIIAARADSN